uniref:Reverse transcriptase domain-containing protein n=1 Tax=Nitella hyalina TaxID=181804 RepID=H9LRW9_NITHY|nr:hypothetical protein [Nitella hyalina]AEH42862.1 hypothetical protein [Nitella hyalina]
MESRWSQLNWGDITKRVLRIQKQIYERTLEGKEVHELQRVLTGLFEAKLLAVRRVTQDNQGKKAGIDGIKSLSSNKRWELARNLEIDGKSDKVKRVWIPKNNSNELRPLGIPTIRDRAKQALALLALEPEWEAKFEPNSYGFRPGRSTLDAIEAIHSSINKKPKYVLDGDIRKCFDRINHEQLLLKLNIFPKMERQVRAWLKAGIVDGSSELFPTEGTPQGGVISPLLSNIALHGMEEMLLKWIETIPAYNPGGTILSKSARRSRLTFVRYADDFVVLHPELEIIKEAKERISKWLEPMGLELHPDKTSIKHTFLEKPGFNFLGFWIRNYPVQRREEGKRRSGYKTYIRPHPDNISRFLSEVRKVLVSTRDVKVVVQRLNPIIMGWSNYFRTTASKSTFTSIDKVLMTKLMNWARKKHPRRDQEWVRNKYLHLDGNRKRFGYLLGETLVGLKYCAETAIVRHKKVTGKASPYDGNWIYWTLRGRDIANRRVSLQTLIRPAVKKENAPGVDYTSLLWIA